MTVATIKHFLAECDKCGDWAGPLDGQVGFDNVLGAYDYAETLDGNAPQDTQTICTQTL